MKKTTLAFLIVTEIAILSGSAQAKTYNCPRTEKAQWVEHDERGRPIRKMWVGSVDGWTSEPWGANLSGVKGNFNKAVCDVYSGVQCIKGDTIICPFDFNGGTVEFSRKAPGCTLDTTTMPYSFHCKD